jgi:hypothetical protein
MPKKEFNKNLTRLVQILFIIIILNLTTLNFEKTNNEEKVLGTTVNIEESINQKISFLEGVVSKNLDYFDANIELSKLYLEKSDKEKAIVYFNNAKSINPNSSEILSLEKLIF